MYIHQASHAYGTAHAVPTRKFDFARKGTLVAKFDTIRDEQFINLTTFKRDGTPVPTPVWFVLYDDRLIITTARSTGKVKRILNKADVKVAPSTRMGKTTGPEQDGKARISNQDTSMPAYQALKRKYGLLFRIIMLIHKVRRHDQVLIEVEPA